MELLTPDEILIVRVARATCFGYRFESGEVPEEDVHRFVDELIALYRRKPKSVLAGANDEAERETLEASLVLRGAASGGRSRSSVDASFSPDPGIR